MQATASCRRLLHRHLDTLPCLRRTTNPRTRRTRGTRSRSSLSNPRSAPSPPPTSFISRPEPRAGQQPDVAEVRVWPVAGSPWSRRRVRAMLSVTASSSPRQTGPELHTSPSRDSSSTRPCESGVGRCWSNWQADTLSPFLGSTRRSPQAPSEPRGWSANLPV